MGSKRTRRRKNLKRLVELEAEIEARHLTDEVVRLAGEFRAKPRQFKLIDEAEWQLLPGRERAQQMAAYYLAIRAEDLVLENEALEANKKGRYTAWLDSPVPKTIALGAALAYVAELAIKGWEVFKLHGLSGGPGDGGEPDDDSDQDDRVHFVL